MQQSILTPGSHKETRNGLPLVGLFPGLDGSRGGVQRSGQVAWQALTDHLRTRDGKAGLIVYGPAAREDLERAKGPAVGTTSRWHCLRSALTRDWRTDLVCVWHMHMLRLLPFMRVGGARVVLVLHGIEAWQPLGFLTRRLLRRVDLFLADSRFTWQRFTQAQPQCVARPHQIVPLGCEQPAPKSLPPAWSAAALLLGRMMRGEDYKGHRELIAAWPAVRARIPEARLWIAGDGDLQPELQGMAARLGLNDSVQFWGRVSEEQKELLLEQSRCLAMPSRGEGFGLVYLEAMRRGRPCLVSNCDAGQEVVQPPEAGLAVDPKDAPALTDAVCRLLTPGAAWEQWSQAARRRYEDHYTAAHYRRRLLKALFDLDS